MHARMDDDRCTGDNPAASDAALARGALEHPDLFAELYRRYRERVYWYLRARVPGDEDAADLTQQVFVGAFSRLCQYREGKASFATWLFTIARNAANDFHRRRRPTVRWDGMPAAQQPIDDRDLAIDVVRGEAIARLRQMVTALPPEKRELLALRYGADLTIPEIAAITGKSPHATYKQLSRLLQLLEDSYDDPSKQT
jgi:RNA polymerase sigma-70 factor (ECF subfamily)